MRHKNSIGFTLIEILVALFIFTIIAMMMVSALHTVLNNQSSVEKETAYFNELQLAMLLISRDMEQIIDRPITNAEGGQDDALRGNAHSITFTRAGFANPQGQLRRSTLQRVRYSQHGENIVRDTWDALDLPPDAVPHSRVILSGVSHLQFEYLDQNKKFYVEWPLGGPSEKYRLPNAVRISLALKKSGTLTQLYPVLEQDVAKKSR